MGRPLRLLNLTLAVVAVLIATALAKTWVSPGASIPDRPVPQLSQEATALAFVPLPRPPLAQFDVIMEKNPFKQPPPVPPQRAGQKPVPPPVPLPILVGTILVDEERRVILSDKGKQAIYSVGQEVAGGVVTEIKADRIMYTRGDDSAEIFLDVAKTVLSHAGGQPIVPAAPALTPAAFTPPLPTAPAERLDKVGKERKKLEQKLRALEKKQQRKSFGR
jgi:type II secretory pathway component PulC